MKESRQKAQKKDIKSRLKGFNLRAYSILLGFGLVAAVATQKRFDPAEISGMFLIAAILMFILYKDITRYRPRYMTEGNMPVLLGLMIAGTLITGRAAEFALHGLSVGFSIDPGAVIYGLPLAAGAVLVTLLFDFHTALLFSFIISLIAGIWQGEAAYPLYVFAGSLAGAFSVIRLRKRTAVLRGGLYVLCANLAATFVILLFGGEILSLKALFSMVFAAFSAVFVVAIVALVLPVLEYLFKATTDISLLELLDLEQPLIKNLMVNAPGTYHHSIIVGNLVEAVAEHVGVNPLLARVGAYYHDVGKIKMPEYFIENTAGISKHEGLTPHMSSMVLVSHVKEGVELAEQHKLPEVVIDIIRQHHGTSLITFFYEKAKGLPNGAELSEEEYKYPGPKPQSRTAALIMMADAVEAASRVLNEPTASRIAALVDKVINHIFLTGQIDDCELTLKDISEVKRRFTYILTGILHRRIDYPGFDFGGSGEGSHKQPAKEDKAKPKADKEGFPEGPQAAAASRGRA